MIPSGDRGTSLARLGGRAIERMLGHVSWFAGEHRSLAGGRRKRPFVLILGREHYTERRQDYPLLGRRVLDKVIRGELAGEDTTIFVQGPTVCDRRVVTFYTFDRDVLENLPRAPVVIPESLLLTSTLVEGDWASIERDEYRYFLFADGRSQPAGGALGASRLVAMAAGLDPDSTPEQWHGHDAVAGLMRIGLRSLALLDWLACRNPLPSAKRLLDIAWRPVGLAAAAGVVSYLLLTTLYLQGTLSYREHALEALAPEVQEGLSADSEMRQLAERQRALAELWSSRADTQQLWAAIASAIDSGATIAQVQLSDDRVSIRGYAPDAAEVLANLTELPRFNDVNFDAPVRADRNGRQNFTLSFEFAQPTPTVAYADD